MYYLFHNTQGPISSDEHVIMWQHIVHRVYVYTTSCIERASVCVQGAYELHCLLCSTACLQSPMSEAVSPSMEDIGEACGGYDDSGMSEASGSSFAITREQSTADSGARTLPHGESSHSISQKWAEVGADRTALDCVTCATGQ